MRPRTYVVQEHKPFNLAPTSVEAARLERSAVVTELQEYQAWFTSMGVPLGAKDHDPQAAEKKKRFVLLQQRSGFLRRWLRENAEVEAFHPNVYLLAKCYQLITANEEALAGADIEPLLAEIEELVPMSVLERGKRR